jgi:hypothetical protein
MQENVFVRPATDGKGHPLVVRDSISLQPLSGKGLEAARSLLGAPHPRSGRDGQKCRPGLCPRRTFSRRNSRPRTETGSNVRRDRFESAP